MLKELISSKTKRKLLCLFLLNPEEEFYLRQITKILGENPRTVQIQLQSLYRLGLISVTRRGNIKYYKTNRDFFIFEELRSIILKTEGLRDVLEKYLKNKDIKIAFVYGSVVKGEDKAYSDIDLFIVGNIKEEKLLKAIRKSESILKREINYNLMNEEEFKQRLKKKDRFLLRVLRDKKIEIIGSAPGI